MELMRLKTTVEAVNIKIENISKLFDGEHKEQLKEEIEEFLSLIGTDYNNIIKFEKEYDVSKYIDEFNNLIQNDKWNKFVEFLYDRKNEKELSVKIENFYNYRVKLNPLRFAIGEMYFSEFKSEFKGDFIQRRERRNLELSDEQYKEIMMLSIIDKLPHKINNTYMNLYTTNLNMIYTDTKNMLELDIYLSQKINTVYDIYSLLNQTLYIPDILSNVVYLPNFTNALRKRLEIIDFKLVEKPIGLVFIYELICKFICRHNELLSTQCVDILIELLEMILLNHQYYSILNKDYINRMFEASYSLMCSNLDIDVRQKFTKTLKMALIKMLEYKQFNLLNKESIQNFLCKISNTDLEKAREYQILGELYTELVNIVNELDKIEDINRDLFNLNDVLK